VHLQAGCQDLVFGGASDTFEIENKFFGMAKTLFTAVSGILA